MGIILPVFEKGKNRDCKNYRVITLLSTVLKVYEKILDQRLKATTDKQMEQSQSGYYNKHAFCFGKK